MYNYQIKDKCANLPALEILAEFQKNPKRDIYETLVQDMAGEMLKTLGDKPKNEETYCGGCCKQPFTFIKSNS